MAYCSLVACVFTFVSFIIFELFHMHSDDCDPKLTLGYRLDRDLGNSNLSGHLVPELGKLEYLQYL